MNSDFIIFYGQCELVANNREVLSLVQWSAERVARLLIPAHTLSAHGMLLLFPQHRTNQATKTEETSCPARFYRKISKQLSCLPVIKITSSSRACLIR